MDASTYPLDTADSSTPVRKRAVHGQDAAAADGLDPVRRQPDRSPPAYAVNLSRAAVTFVPVE